MSNFSDYLEQNNLLIIDSMNLAFRWKHERFKLSENMENHLLELLAKGEVSEDDIKIQIMDFYREEGAYFGEEFASTVQSLASSYSAERIIMATDFGKSSFRKGIYPDYKENRVVQKELRSVVAEAVFNAFFTMYQEALDNEVAEVAEIVRFHGVEADDIAAFICNNTDAKKIYKHIWLVTSDADWDLNIDDQVSRFNWMTKNTWLNITKTAPRPKEITIDNWDQHYLYYPEYHLTAKCLEGDTGDNIPGIAGIGPVRANDIMNKYGDINDIIAAMPLKGNAQYIKNLNENKEQLKLNIKLMDLVTYAKDAVGEHANTLKEMFNV